MDPTLQTLVGKKIRQFRLANTLTIEELAFRAQLHPAYLGDVERGRRNPSLINLKKIADGLKIPLTDLFSDVPRAGAAAVSTAGEKTAVYIYMEKDHDLLSLIKSIRNNSPKDRKRIIQIAKSLSASLKK